MKAVVFGYQEIGYVCLEELLAFGVQVSCLFTHEDDPHEEIWFRRPVTVARKHNIPVYTPETLKDEKWIKLIEDAAPDFIFSFYYRNMISKRVLDIPRVAALNLHGSLLPKFRGRAPVNWVLVAGESQTGVTLHEMVEKPDAGDIVAQKKIEIALEDDVYTLYMKMTDAARQLMKETLPKLVDGSFVKTSQTGMSSYFGGRKPEDGLISWQQNATTLYNLVRAVTHPYPGAFTYLGGKKIFVWKAHPENDSGSAIPGKIVSSRPLTVSTGRGLLKLLRVQWEGEEEMDAEAFVSIHSIENEILGGSA
ncbi:MAG: formyltransferase [Syntrophus sp. (in: bacteria)]|nr:formyltransferase [Syntrophus sp. (in: bacteria)]